MYLSKIILSLFMSSIFLLSCKDKKKIEPEPKEYFSFDANGVHYDYPQDVKYGFGTSRRAIYALPSSVGYLIVGSSFKNPTAEGIITFNFSENHIPTEDTIILDGVKAIATIEDFLNIGNSFRTNYSYNGMVVFSKRTNTILEGTFDFQAQQQYDSSIIHITNGKFSIIPSH